MSKFQERARMFSQAIREVSEKRYRLVLWLCLLIIFLFIAISIWTSYVQYLNERRDYAFEIAAQAVKRTDAIRVHTFDAFVAMEEADEQEPCADSNIARMRTLAYESGIMIDVGYVEDNFLKCSSLGIFSDPIFLGPLDYVSPSGANLRLRVQIPQISNTEQFLTTSNSLSGYTAILLADWSRYDLMELNSDAVVFGVVHQETGQPLFLRGNSQLLGIVYDLVKHSDDRISREGDYFIAFAPSTFGYIGFAVVPVGNVKLALVMALPELLAALTMGLVLSALMLWYARRQNSLPKLIKNGIRNGEFYMVYQPVIELASEHWVGFEALVRWRQKNGTIICPGEFIPVAEQNGLMPLLTDCILEMVFEDLKKISELRPDFHMALNVSGDDLVEKDFYSRILAAGYQRSDLKKLILEVTERVFLDGENVEANLKVLKGKGAEVAIDDFGTGYSSLSYLTHLDIDFLKIDKIFVDTIGSNSVTSEVIDHIISLAKSLRLTIVAEGVETSEQADFLRKNDVELAQGWLFSKPLTIEQILSSLPDSRPRL